MGYCHIWLICETLTPLNIPPIRYVVHLQANCVAINSSFSTSHSLVSSKLLYICMHCEICANNSWKCIVKRLICNPLFQWKWCDHYLLVYKITVTIEHFLCKIRNGLRENILVCHFVLFNIIEEYCLWLIGFKRIIFFLWLIKTEHAWTKCLAILYNVVTSLNV